MFHDFTFFLLSAGKVSPDSSRKEVQFMGATVQFQR